MLYEGLDQLSKSGLIARDKELGYVVTPLGASLRPMLEQAWAWGERHAQRRAECQEDSLLLSDLGSARSQGAVRRKIPGFSER